MKEIGLLIRGGGGGVDGSGGGGGGGGLGMNKQNNIVHTVFKVTSQM